ncbi:MAG TPA: sensor histidine kinase [Longimicrobiales bacterium]|nr:sensor histidine kinase [Longimicrobiales bacterium]
MPRPRGRAQPEIQASRSLMQVAEWELQQVLQDIHDGPVQHMYAALSQLDLLQRALEASPAGPSAEAWARLDRIRRLLEAGLADIRTYIGGYRTPEFDSRELVPLLQGLAMQHEALTDTRVPIEVPGPVPEPPLPVKIALYRVLQEGLSNAYRHGGAAEVAVRLAVDGTAAATRLRLTLRDDGAGFDVDRLPPGRHFGLQGMRDRMGMVGGSFQLDSAPGGGTTITVEVPLR